MAAPITARSKSGSDWVTASAAGTAIADMAFLAVTAGVVIIKSTDCQSLTLAYTVR